MSKKMCVMCELAYTVDIMPVGKSLNKFGLLSKEIYHDLHKSTMNEGIKWRGLLHSINFQENKLARLALIELIRIDNPVISEELEKPDHSGQISCICGLRTNGPRLKRSNSLSHIVEGSRNGSFSFEQSHLLAFNTSFPQYIPSEQNGDEWKYMSLQPMKSPTLSNSYRRRSRSLEILRPFTPLDRETFIPKDSFESSSESEGMDDEIDYIFAGIANLNKDYDDENGSLDDLVNHGNGLVNITHGTKDQNDSVRSKSNQRLDFEDDHFASPSGFPSTSSVDTVLPMDEDSSGVFSESSFERSRIDNLRENGVSSPDLESTRDCANVTSHNDVTVTSHNSQDDVFLTASEHASPLSSTPFNKGNTYKRTGAHVVSTRETRKVNKVSWNTRTNEVTQMSATAVKDYNVLIVLLCVLVCLLLLGWFLFPESLISSLIVLTGLQLYTTNRKR